MDAFIDMLLFFLLVMTRMTTFFVIAPVFSQRGIPPQFKIGMAAAMSVLVTSQVQLAAENLTFGWIYLGLVVKEALVGLILGFAAAIIFIAIQMAGALIDLQIGFALANLIDPTSGLPMPLTAHFKVTLATLFFLAINGHHHLIAGLFNSYQLVAAENFLVLSSPDLAQWVSRFFAQSFVIALQVAAPMAGALFLVDLVLGIIARTVPQMNFFAVGFPLKMIISFLLLLLVLPGFFAVLSGLFERMFQSMGQIIEVLGM